ncbi:MAG TPA: cellulase family glycosylhydrolase [Spirochaetia bacterium]|nr:cellulase family glycosylhydrolase [Spirochaetia bacterium]
MGFVHFDSDGLLIGPSGEPRYVVGINYVASYICTNFWEDFRPAAIEKDLDGIQALGLNAVRIPVHWGFAEPEIGVYSEIFFQRFDAFLDMAGRRGLLVMPWFLVGIATKSYDFPFRNGRSFFTGEMLDIEERHLKAITGRYRNDERILMWDICDEPEYFSFNEYSEQLPYKRPVMARWVKTLADAIRSVDANHLVTLGYGAIATQHFGIHVRDAAEALDLMVVTAYPGPSHEQIDRYRNNYFLPYNVRFNTLGKPVLSCEAPGSTSVAFSEEVIGNYFRVALYGNLLAGASGALPWVYNDFQREIWHEKPLEEATFEPSFGIVTTDGRLKPSGAALAEFARFANEQGIGSCRPPAARAAILVPRRYYEEIEPAYKKLYTTFILAKASVDAIDFLWEDQDPSRYRLVLIPSTRGMTTSAWDRLRRFVEAGGTILCIHDDRRGLSAYFNDLFGVETITTEKDHGYEGMVAREAWGGFHRGERFAFAPNSRSEILRVQARSARVLFAFEDGLPAFVVNGLGRGKAFLATRPLEDGLLDCRYEEFLESRCFDLHAALTEEAGVSPEFSCPDRRVEVGALEKRGTDERLIVCINHDTSAVSTRLLVRGEERALELAPAGVKVFTVER